MHTPPALKYARIALPLWREMALPEGDAILETALEMAEPAARAGDVEYLDYLAGIAHACEIEAMRKADAGPPWKWDGWRDAAKAAHLAWLALREMSGVRHLGPQPMNGWPADRFAARFR